MLGLPAPRAQLQLAGAPGLVSQLGFMKQDAQAALQILGSGREGGMGEVGPLDHRSAANTPSAAARGLGGTALAPQLQPLLCSPVCEINAPHLLFLLPGNRARQRIKPGGLFSPARFPGRHMEYKARRALSLGQVTEQLLSAQLDPPALQS